MSTETEDARDLGTQMAISNEMVRLYKTQFGRGPTRARTHWAGADVVVVVLEDTLTPAERNLVEMGEHQRLRDTRTFFQYATVREFCEPVERLTGRRPTLMRPPQGRTDADVHRIAKEEGLAEVLWSVTAKDYTTEDSALITKRVLDQASRDGIILLHDIYRGTVPAVPGIIDALKARGYVFVTVPQLLAPGKAEPGKVYRP